MHAIGKRSRVGHKVAVTSRHNKLGRLRKGKIRQALKKDYVVSYWQSTLKRDNEKLGKYNKLRTR